MNRYFVLLVALFPLPGFAQESPRAMPTPFVLNPSPLQSPTPFVLSPSPQQSPTPFVLNPSPQPTATPLSPPLSNAPSPQPVAVNLTAGDLGPFVEGLMNAELAWHDIAGGVVTVVKDGQILLCKGFGYSDFARRQTVVPDRTLFRPGSITKLFTAIAVMQLVEAGKIDLDRDINDYLDFKIPATFLQPITMRNLLTHTAGFDMRLRNLFVSRREELQPLRDYLIAEMPDRLFSPGAVPAYSNYGLSLAGYIVERVSGVPFKEYVRYQIFRPLQMEHSTFDQPLPEDLLPDMSNGYKTASDPAGGFEFIQAVPAGALSTTGVDMGRFMAALLNQGALEGAQIISQDSLQKMEDRVLVLDPKLNAMGLVFMERRPSSPRIIGHGGDSVYFHSDLILIPEQRVGFFVSLNTAGTNGHLIPEQIVQAFLDRYYPAPPGTTEPISSQSKDADLVKGFYQASTRSDSTFLRFATLVQQLNVTADANGVLTIDLLKDGRGSAIRWQEIAPLIYREINGEQMIGFRHGANEQISDLVPTWPIAVFQKVSLTQSRSFVFWLVGPAFGLIAITALLFPLAMIVRGRYKRPLFEANAGATVLYLFSRLWCLIIVAFAVAVYLFLTSITGNVSQISSSQDRWLDTIHWLAWIGLGGAVVVMGIATLYFWIGQYGTLLNRLHTFLLLAASGVLLWFGQTYHFMDSSLRF
ncbi:MAG TPA: serine hydrolase [Chthoniobacterales bacterium]|nr:serine hydrolase [Chthoniobacterales bacterium]